MGTYSITPTVAQGMLNSTGYAEALGTSPTLKIYSGTVPANAAATNTGTLLATLACAATPISGYSDTGTAGRATFAAIASATAVATGTASFWRRQTSGSTVVDQGSCATSGSDLNLNTTSVTSGSTVSVTSATTDFPYGP
jgi:hypothetical protein